MYILIYVEKSNDFRNFRCFKLRLNFTNKKMTNLMSKSKVEALQLEQDQKLRLQIIRNTYQRMGLKSKYKQTYPLQKRLQMVTQRNLYEFINFRAQDQIVLIVQKDPKCKAYSDINSKIFVIYKHQKVIEVYNTIRKKIITQDKKFENFALFIFTTNRILNKDMTIGQLYEKQNDHEDSILYIFYSDMEPF